MTHLAKNPTYADALALVKRADEPEMVTAVLATMDAGELRHLAAKLIGLVGMARSVLADVENTAQWCDAIAPHLPGHDDSSR